MNGRVVYPESVYPVTVSASLALVAPHSTIDNIRHNHVILKIK